MALTANSGKSDTSGPAMEEMASRFRNARQGKLTVAVDGGIDCEESAGPATCGAVVDKPAADRCVCQKAILPGGLRQ